LWSRLFSPSMTDHNLCEKIAFPLLPPL
jgi:hypothetical protein